MYFNLRRSFLLLLIFTVTICAFQLVQHFQLPAEAAQIEKDRAIPTHQKDKTETNNSIIKLPLSFEANYGQADSKVKFLARGGGYSLYLTTNQAVLKLRIKESVKRKNGGKIKAGESRTATVCMKLVGANSAPLIAGTDELPGKNNYLIGNDPKKWRTNVPTFAKVKYESVYPGVDAVYYGNQRQIEYDFVVAPGADPKTIKLSYQGAQNLSINPDGDLILQTRGGEIRQSKPVVYQEVDGVRRNIQGGYIILDKSKVAFDIGTYDRTRPLVIDPVLIYSTFLGGNADDATQDIAVDGAGNAYLTGYTKSVNFPVAGAGDPSFNGNYDVFVTKLDATGTTVLYSTYLGGGNDELGLGIALDSAGNSYVTGGTLSTNFPITPGAADTICGGCAQGQPNDSFITKLDGNTGALIYSTFVGGDSYEQAYAIAVDNLGNAYISGGIAYGYPYCGGPNAFQTPNGYKSCASSYYDAFLTKVNPNGTAFLYSTTIGGANDEYAGHDVAVDNIGNAYVAGITRTPNFETTAGAYDSNCGTSFVQHNGIFDAFVMKINTNVAGAASRVYSTCVGGSADDGPGGIGIDGAGNIWLTGSTSSTDFPTVNAFDSSANGAGDAFLVKLNPFAVGSGQLVYGSYLGGSGSDGGSDVVESNGNVYVVGTTASTNFPIADALQLHQGNNDAFVTKLNPAAAGSSQLLFSTYLGACGNDGARRIALDAADNAYIVGNTNSPAFPTTTGAYQSIYGGDGDGFVAKISGSGPTITVPGCGSIDSDGDGVLNSTDNCPLVANLDQADNDGDGIGDACDPNPNDGPTGDSDGDGVINNVDNCPLTVNPDQFDTDGDGIGNACDADDDGDGVADGSDNCPLTANADQLDTDGDGQGNVCDPDDDNDGVLDGNDAFPLNPNESVDTDGDGIGNNADPDDDNDGQSDVNETACGSDPLNAASKSTDTDNDGIPNCVDSDDDGDGIPDTCDVDSNPGANDFDRDGIVDGSGCDTQIGPPKDKDQCKNGGWQLFNFPRKFKNQGDCIQFVNTGK